MCKIIAISGTPGTGKTSVAHKLAENIGAEAVIDLSKLAIEKGFYIDFDRERNTYIVDEDSIRSHIYKICRDKDKVIVVHGHFSEIVPEELLEKLFILRLDPVKLIERLAKRCWSKEKILENIESEILGICTYNAINEIKNKNIICEIDISGLDIDSIVNKMINLLKNKNHNCSNQVDWISKLDELDIHYLNKLIEDKLEEFCSRR